MRIDITGYVTEARGKDGFQIKVTSDKVHNLFSDIQVSKEVSVHINKYHYPNNYYSEFQEIGQNESVRREITECRSLCDTLKKGDQVECAVFIVDTEFRNDTETHVINSKHREIKDYADSFLWLYPKTGTFKRLEADSQESLKFRKQWFYTWVNKEKCAEIVGSTFNNYSNKWWINKPPKLIFPMLWGVRFRTVATRLWEYYKNPKNTTITRIIATVSPLIAFASLILNVWLFIRKP